MKTYHPDSKHHARHSSLVSILACAATLALSAGCASLSSSSGVAGSEVSAAPAKDDFEIAKRYAKSRQLDLYSYHMRYLGNKEGIFSPILRTRDGGFLINATRGSNPVVVKLDATGKLRWEQSYTRSGFATHEGGSAVELPDGYLVFVSSYVHPARGSVTRLLRIDTSGRTVWNLQLRGNGGQKTPFPHVLRLVGNTIKLDGHIYLDASEQAYFWRGEVDLQGKLKLDAPGAKIRSWKDGLPQP